ncbi:MAG: PAS domain S-box protein [Armatimonadota bacterium]
MGSFSRLGLRGRVALLIALSMAPALGLLLYTTQEQRQLAVIEAGQIAQRLSRVTASNEDALFLATHHFLGLLARVPQVRYGDARTCTAFLRGLHGEYPLFLNLGRVELDGDITSSSLPLPGQVNVADRLWFKNALTKEFSVGEYQIGRITGKPSINFGHPVLDEEGRVRWVVFSALDLKWVEQTAAKAKLPTDSIVTVTDREDVILARYPQGAAWVGKTADEVKLAKSKGLTAELILNYMGPDGIRRVYAFTPLGGKDARLWLTVGVPCDTVFAEVDRLLVRNLIIMSIVTVLAVAAAFWGVDLLILRSLNSLIRSTEQVAQGNLSVRTGLGDSRWELGKLALAFDQMAEALQQRARESQQAVRRNTLLLALYEKSGSMNQEELHAYALDLAVSLTDSTLGFLHSVSADGQNVILNIWNAETRGQCSTVPAVHYPIAIAGNWADAVRLRRPVVCNDYPECPDRKGLPEGHPDIRRFVSVPVLEERRVVYVLGVANKATEYSEDDVVQLQLASHELQKILRQREAELALRESETKFRFLFDTMAQGVLVQDPEGAVLEANQAAADILGLSMEELLARTSASPEWDLIHEDGRPLTAEDMVQSIAMRTGKPVTGLVVGMRRGKDREYRWLLASAVPRYQPGADKPFLTMTTFTDITERKRTQEDLIRLSTLLDQTQSLAGVGGWEIDLRTNQLYWTSQTYRTHEVSPAEYTPTVDSAIAFYTPESQAVLRAALQDVIEKGTGFSLELELINAKGRRLQIYLTGRAIREGSKTVKIIGAGRDITADKQAQRALRESEERFRAVFESAYDAILVLDADTIVDCNPQAVEMYGCDDKSDLIGHTPLDFSPPIQPDRRPSAQAARAHINAARDGMPQRFYWHHTRKDGTPFYAEVSLSRLALEGGALVQAIVRDVTDRKKAEQELRLAHAELELRVQQRTAELSRSNAELEQFAYVASHDLQEPLRKIMAFGDRLQIGAGTLLDERSRDYLERMLNAASRMSGLINDLLAYSRITTKAQPFVPVDLTKVTEEVLSDLEVAIEEAGATVEVGELPTIDADPSQMRQLLQNLIGNALKFRREAVPLLVRVEAEVRPPPPIPGAGAVRNMMHLRVIDNGIGFEEKFADRIFEVFERLHSRDEYPGSGMGLAICRKIVERHHGAIRASSTPGEGSVFTVILPVEQPQESMAPNHGV